MTDSADARADVLAAIKAGLQGELACELPAAAPVFPPEAPLDAGALAASFGRELAALKGEMHSVASMPELPAALARLLDERGLSVATVQNSARVNAALEQVSRDRFFQAADASPQRIEKADCGIIEAEALLADTGSVVAIFKNLGERLLPFLPPTCIVIADAAQLRPHMDDVALKAMYDAARNGARGEGVIITGPSRSADIEKVLVLGAHGPRALIVLIAGIP